MKPETKYAKSGDVRVAYQVTGKGSTDIVWAPGTTSHLDLDWDWPARANFIEHMSSFCRLIRFDKRGTGLSDRPTKAATLEERIDDIRAVMEAAGSDQATMFGVSEGANMACLFAATYPSRTRALIVWGGQARWIKTDDYPWGLTEDEYKRMVEDLTENGVTLYYLTGPGAGLKNADAGYLEWFWRYARAGSSPSSIAALERMNSQIDTRDILPTIRVPTLVMNRTGDPVANVEAARDLAKRIPGAKFLEFPGDTHSFYGVADQILEQIEVFVTGARPHTPSNRVLATILFLDIVDSTKYLEEMGDSAWRTLLARHNGLVRKELADFHGIEVKTTGDGFLATFDGPTRAIQCARAIRDSVRSIGIEVRAGLHTGECELMDSDVGGIAVHVAARVAALATSGEVLVSSTVKDLVAGSGLRFEDRGTHVLKGVTEEWHLFAAQ